MNLTEAEDIQKRWQEYTEKLYKKDLKQKIFRRGGKNTQKNYTKKILMTQITVMV